MKIFGQKQGQSQNKNSCKKLLFFGPSNQRYYRTNADFHYLEKYHYKIVKELGRGGYGIVYKAKDLNIPGRQYAIKINFNTVSREVVYAEIAFLQLIKGKRGLPIMKNLLIEKQTPHIVIEYCKSKPFITFFAKFKMQDISHYLIELLIGLKSLKDLGIYHRDIKPANYLYNPQTKKGIIVDFGLAEIDKQFFKELQRKIINMKIANHPQFPQYREKFFIYENLISGLQKIGVNKVGTEGFVPLQTILHHPQQSYSSDIWPVGVIMLQFLCRKYNIFCGMKQHHNSKDLKNPYLATFLIQLSILFGKQKVIKQCNKMGYKLTLPDDIQQIELQDIICNEQYDENAEDLLLKMLCLNPKKRISVQDAISHPFFDLVRSQHC